MDRWSDHFDCLVDSYHEMVWLMAMRKLAV